MKELMEGKIQEWQQGLEQMQTQRVNLAQQLAEIDAAYSRTRQTPAIRPPGAWLGVNDAPGSFEIYSKVCAK
jgi:hypothetical protein